MRYNTVRVATAQPDSCSNGSVSKQLHEAPRRPYEPLAATFGVETDAASVREGEDDLRMTSSGGHHQEKTHVGNLEGRAPKEPSAS